MSVLAGKVYMEAPDGSRRFVAPDRVKSLEARGAKVVPVRVRKQMPSGPIERTLPGDYGTKMGQLGVWARDPDVEVVEQGQEGVSTPVSADLAYRGRQMLGDAVASAPMVAASMLAPGVAGLRPALARTLTGFGAGVPGELSGQVIRGEQPDLGRAAIAAGVGAAMGVPFEIGAAKLPKLGPRMLADVLKPTKAQQKAIEAVEGRQTGQKTTAEYERAGRALAQERMRPSKEAEAKLEELNSRASDAVNDILDQADAVGFKVLPRKLARSPEIMELRAQLRKESDDPKGSVRELHKFLGEFVRARSTPGTKPKASGLVSASGQPIVTPGTPARQKPMSANRLGRQAPSPDEGEKQVWRRESSPILKAREAGTNSDKIQGLRARASDALARAAKRELDAIQFTTADPEMTGAQVDMRGLNERLERRIPLQEMVRDFNMRPPLSSWERYMLFRGRVPISENIEGGLGLAFSDPRFVPDLLSARPIIGGAAQDMTRTVTR